MSNQITFEDYGLSHNRKCWYCKARGIAKEKFRENIVEILNGDHGNEPTKWITVEHECGYKISSSVCENEQCIHDALQAITKELGHHKCIK